MGYDIFLHAYHPKKFCTVYSEFDSGEIWGRVQSLARNGLSSMWSPRSIVLLQATETIVLFIRGFKKEEEFIDDDNEVMLNVLKCR